MVQIVGHRGAAGTQPENTLQSFKTAIKQGADTIEMDVWLTKDKHAVVIHDQTVDRTTNGTGKITEKTLAQAKKLKCKKGQKIPTLEEVIKKLKGKTRFQIELKGKGTPKKVTELIQKHNIEKSVLVTSFHTQLLRETKKQNPKIRVGLLYGKSKKRLWKKAGEVPLDWICPKAEHLKKETVEKAHKLGKKVYAWRANNKMLGEKMKQMKVDAIGTDYPEMLTKE